MIDTVPDPLIQFVKQTPEIETFSTVKYNFIGEIGPKTIIYE